MLRRKHRTTANLKQDEDRKISRYLDSFLSQIRHPVNRIIRRNDVRNDEVTKGESTSGSSNKETTRPEKIETQKKLRTIDNAVTIGLTNLDKPGPSRIQSKTPQTSQKKSKTTREKTTQMYQNLSTQRLKGSEDIDEDVSDSSLLEDDQPRPKYILVGWDSFRSKLMLLLLILLILWAVIYFPLIGT